MNTKNNKRGRDTDEKIVRAMFRVMTRENKALSSVTVREICQEAGINRSSFYAHYQDVFEVMERVEATMAKGLTEAFVEKLDHGSGIGELISTGVIDRHRDTTISIGMRERSMDGNSSLVHLGKFLM